MSNPFPAHVRRVALVAPAGPADPEQVDAGMEQLRRWGIEPVPASHLKAESRAKYLAASEQQRAAELEELWLRPDVDLIMCVRGGFGCAHLLPLLDWEKLRRRPIPLVGYSDITAFHLAMLRQQAGIPLAGPMGIRMHTIDDYTINGFRHALSDEPLRRVVLPDGGDRLDVLRSGAVSGPVFAANLAVMVTLCGTDWMPDLSGWILLVEDVGEPVYRLDRYLTQLEQCGMIGSCAGLIFGGFSDCGMAEDREILFRRVAEHCNGPVLSGFPFGHSFPLLSLRQGGRMEITLDGAVYF